MASALHTKINSYAIQRGFEYADNPITVNPARTGTNTLNTAHSFSTPPPIYVNDGPAGGNGCVEVRYAITGSGNSPTYFRHTSNQGTDYAGVMTDGDWSIGFWFKYTSLPTGTNHTSVNVITTFNACVNFKVAGSTSAYPSKLVVGLQSSSNAAVIVNETILVNTWYYVAVTRTTAASNNVNVYLNGTLRNTVTDTVISANPFGGGWGTSAAQNTNAVLRACNLYTASSSVIGAAEIAEIWTVGSTTPSTGRTVKYYNGTAWVNSSAQKVYNGTAWVDWTAKKYDGTAWVTI
jgi:hypothetical protein